MTTNAKGMKPSEGIFIKTNQHIANGKEWDVATLSAIIEYLDEQYVEKQHEAKGDV